MDGIKNMLMSKTVWAGIIAALASLLKLFGYELDSDTQNLLMANIMGVATNLLDLVTLAAGLFAVYGRVKATKKLQVKAPKKLGCVVALLFCLSACATGGTKVNNCLRDIAAVEAGVSAGYDQTYKLTLAGTLSKDKAWKALKALDAANAAVDNAVPLCMKSDPTWVDFLRAGVAAMADFKLVTGAYK